MPRPESHRPGDAARRAHLKFQVKGSVVRGRVHALHEIGATLRIVSHLDPEARALVDSVPPASSWIDGARLAELDDVICDVLGESALEALATATGRQSVGPLLRGMTEGTLRLFGAGPATLLSRMGTLSATTVRGVAFDWRAGGARRGTMIVTFTDSRDVPRSSFIAVRPGLADAFVVCGVDGKVELLAHGEGGARNSARYECTW